jgi:hypothetical protein
MAWLSFGARVRSCEGDVRNIVRWRGNKEGVQVVDCHTVASVPRIVADGYCFKGAVAFLDIKLRCPVVGEVFSDLRDVSVPSPNLTRRTTTHSARGTI